MAKDILPSKEPAYATRLLPISIVVVVLALVLLAFDMWTLLITPRKSSLERTMQMSTALSGKESSVPILLFSASWCGVCRAAESLLEQYNIPYVNADIEKNKLAYDFYRELTEGYYSGVPLIVVGQEVILGYRPAQTLQAVSRLKGQLPEWQLEEGVATSAPKQSSPAVR